MRFYPFFSCALFILASPVLNFRTWNFSQFLLILLLTPLLIHKPHRLQPILRISISLRTCVPKDSWSSTPSSRPSEDGAVPGPLSPANPGTRLNQAPLDPSDNPKKQLLVDPWLKELAGLLPTLGGNRSTPVRCTPSKLLEGK